MLDYLERRAEQMAAHIRNSPSGRVLRLDQTGDTTVAEWTQADPATVERAIADTTALVAQGYVAMSAVVSFVDADGGRGAVGEHDLVLSRQFAGG